ncbi:MAG: site-2 protease family protein [Planctomycetaceae bacterium]
MNRDNPQYWSISCGTWLSTQVRVSVYFPFFILAICLQLRSFKYGLIFGAIYFLSVVLHEFGHVLTSRRTGGSGQEILIWPFGGLAFVQSGESFRSQFLTVAAGPLSNLALCGVTLWPTWRAGLIPAALHPLTLPDLALSGSSLGSDLLVLFFCANWKLFLVNAFIPVYPLDCGRLVQISLRARVGAETALEYALRIGYGASILVVLAGLILENHWVVFLGAVLFIINMAESMQARPTDNFDDSFMGYDFSQGYTSLEKSREAKPTRRPGLIERWRERRKLEKQRRLQLEEEQEQLTLDALLQKVHTDGIESLSDAERRKLQHMSERLRGRGKPEK